MSDRGQPQDQTPSVPDTSLKRLDRLVGSWNLKGRPLGADEDRISGNTTFKWLSGGFFLVQDMNMDYDGTSIKSHELIGFNPKTGAFSSYVYSNMAPDPWPYEWDVTDDNLTIMIKFGPMSATFHGKFSPDGNSFSGGWRPNPGADETINAPYDITALRS